MSSRIELNMKFGLMMNKSFLRVVLIAAFAAVFLAQSSCSRLLPARKGTAHSAQLPLDTRRAPVVQLSGCFIPAVFPAVTKLPVLMVQKIPPTAVFKTATVEVLSKTGEMAKLEAVIENNQVYLNFAVPSVDSFTQYNILVRTTYEYR